MRTLWQDLKYGVRMLRAQPTFTVVAILALSLGIGANTAIFSVINTVLLRPLPYAAPEQLTMVWEALPGNRENSVAPGNLTAWRERNQVFADLAAYTEDTFNLSGGGEPEKLEGLAASANLFPLLGVQPLLGRTFSSEEDQPGANRVAVISYGLWQRRFGGSPNAIGSRVMLDGASAEIIGVMSPSFYFPTRQQSIWTPLALTPAQAGTQMAHFLRVVARIKPSITHQQAQAEMSAIAARLEKEFPQTNITVGANVVPLKDQFVGNLRLALLVLFAAAGFVLLVACTNVANLLLFRAASRQKEIAVRLALGAGRWRLIRQLLTESLMLSLTGGVAGLMLALWGVSTLAAVMPEKLASAKAVTLDLRVLAFTLLVSMLTGIIFGLVPAFQSTRLNLNAVLKEGGRDAARGRSGLRSLLVVAEIALALVLLVGAGLMINSFLRLRQVDTGFKADGLLTLEIDPTLSRFPDQTSLAGFYDRLIERIGALPGVESAGVVTRLPLTPTSGTYLFFAEAPSRWKPASALPNSVSPNYFQVMGMTLLSGRAFTLQDTPETTPTAIINEAMARHAWPGQDPLGKRLRMYPYNHTAPTFTVIGVVKDAKQSEMQAAAKPEVYRSYKQLRLYPPRNLVVRTKVAPQGLAAAIRQAIWEVNKDQPVSNIRTMEEVIGESVSNPRFNMLLLAIFAALALLLAAVGIYGVMSYMVMQHTREIGIRMALGAQASDVLKLVVGKGLILTIAGVVSGVAGAFGLTRLMATLLYGVTATDPLTFAAVSALLATVALLACYLPARRATKVDPMVALRYE